MDDSFFQSLEELKTDPDFNTMLTEFDDALNGRRNMMTIGKLIGLLFVYVSVLCFELISVWTPIDLVVLILSRFVEYSFCLRYQSARTSRRTIRSNKRCWPQRSRFNWRRE